MALLLEFDANLNRDKTLSVQNALGTNVALMASGWYKASETILKSLFDGSEDSMKTLTSMIDGGKLQDFTPPTSVEIKDTVIKSMYSFLIPMAWSAGGDGHAPFILDAGRFFRILYRKVS
tara:strand:+ start:446 stop:805 length:360 start_codon:yes stop_codon:yes gene_type:complete